MFFKNNNKSEVLINKELLLFVMLHFVHILKLFKQDICTENVI